MKKELDRIISNIIYTENQKALDSNHDVLCTATEYLSDKLSDDIVNYHKQIVCDINKKYLDKLNEIEHQYEDDIEILHGEADNILCELIEELGYTEIVKKFKGFKKYYS